MKNELFFQIGPIKAKLMTSDAMFWQTWKWKLDPYTVKNPGESCDLAISLTPSEERLEPRQLLSHEDAGFFCHRVYSTATGEYLWHYERIKNGEVVLNYRVSHSFDAIQLLEDHSDTNGSLAFEYLAQMMPPVLLLSGMLSFHGVLMEYDRKGIILSAASGTGKTTHARLWRNLEDAFIINGDRSTCRKTGDAWTGYGLPWSGTSGEQMSRSVPVTAMVVLEQGLENHAEVLRGLEVFSKVLPHFLYPKWNRELSSTAMDLLDDFLKQVPVIRLQCRPDEEAVRILKGTLEGLVWNT